MIEDSSEIGLVGTNAGSGWTVFSVLISGPIWWCFHDAAAAEGSLSLWLAGGLVHETTNDPENWTQSREKMKAPKLPDVLRDV